MPPSRKLWYSKEDKNIAVKKLKKSKCRTLRRSADRKMVCTACFYFREEYMERTKFEIEHAMAQNAASSSDRQEICGSEQTIPVLMRSVSEPTTTRKQSKTWHG